MSFPYLRIPSQLRERRELAFLREGRMRVVIYARASNDGRGLKASVASQIARGNDWSAGVGATVVATLVDNDLSASRYATEVRDDYEETLRLLATGEANCLWTWENSRAQRELGNFVRLRDILDVVGGFWAYDDRIYDMNDPDDRITVAEDAVDAERESEKLRKRVLRGVENRARSGLWAGPLSYGYRIRYDPDTGEAFREIDEMTCEFAREIVLTLSETGNETALAKELESHGVPCARATRWRSDHVKKLRLLAQDAIGWAKFTAQLDPEQLDSAYEALVRARTEHPSQVAKDMNRGHWAHPLPGKWDAAKVRNIGLNPALAGLRVYQGRVIGKGKWDPIITEEEHHTVVAILGDPSRRNVKDGDRVKWLLSGILLCGRCEVGVAAHMRRGQMVYRCKVGHMSRNMAKTNSVVVERVLLRLSSDTARELFQFDGTSKDLTDAVRTAQDLRARLDGFTDKAADGELSPERLARIEAKLLPRIEAAEARARQIGVSPAVAKLIGPDARAVWETMHIRQKREVLRALVRPRLLPTTGGRAPFNPDHIDITWLGRPAPVPGVDDETEASAAA